MAKTAVMSIGVSGMEISIDYNESNRRLTQASWVLLPGYAARVRVWNNDVLVLDRTIGGPATGAQSIPGNVQLVETVIGGNTVLVLPSNITYDINIESIGQ